jgi:hypothetical protein
MNEELINDLKQLPEVIRVKEKEMYEDHKWIKKQESLLNFERLSVMKFIIKENEIAKERGEKIPYSNSEKRESECSKRIEAKFKDLLESIDKHKDDCEYKKIDFGCLKRSFTSAIAQSRVLMKD